MQALKIKTLLFLTVLMFAAKPFVGFSMFYHARNIKESNILIKAFSKRKQEHNEDSEFNMAAVQQRLANPVIGLSLLFAFFLDIILPAFGQIDLAVNKVWVDRRLNHLQPIDRCLLTGKLLI